MEPRNQNQPIIANDSAANSPFKIDDSTWTRPAKTL